MSPSYLDSREIDMPKPKLPSMNIVKPVVVVKPKEQPKIAPKQPTISKNKPVFVPAHTIVEDSKWTIIPPNLPTAVTTTYRPDKDPYPFYTVPNGASAAIGKPPKDKKPAQTLRVPRPQRKY